MRNLLVLIVIIGFLLFTLAFNVHGADGTQMPVKAVETLVSIR